MFGRLFGKPKEEPNIGDSLDKLKETQDLLEKKEKLLLKRIAAELEKAKEFSKAKNKKAAIQALKKKKLLEVQVENLVKFQNRLEDQVAMLESATMTDQVAGAMRVSAYVLKGIQKKMNIDDVDKTMDEINEQTENMKQIQDALAQPVGAMADIDDDELLEGLEELQEELDGLDLDEELLQPAVTAPEQKLPSVPTQTPTVRATPVTRTAVAVEEDDPDLEALRREMAM